MRGSFTPPAHGSLFQSAPGREAGRCCVPFRRHAAGHGFNPRPAVRPGDAIPEGKVKRFLFSFNPRPAVRPGDACAFGQHAPPPYVSIRARP